MIHLINRFMTWLTKSLAYLTLRIKYMDQDPEVCYRDIGNSRYQHIPAVWVTYYTDGIGDSTWVDIFTAPAPYLSPEESERLWVRFGR